MAIVKRGLPAKMAAAIQEECHDIAHELPVRHFHAPGTYTRELSVPAGVLLVGKKHRHSHVNIISKGRAEVYCEELGVFLVEAPCTFVSAPGTQRVIHALEDLVWITVHATHSTDLLEIEREVIVQDCLEDLT